MCIRLMADHHITCEAGIGARHVRTVKDLVWLSSSRSRDGVGVLLRMEIAGFRLGCASEMMSDGSCIHSSHFTLARSLRALYHVGISCRYTVSAKKCVGMTGVL